MWTELMEEKNRIPEGQFTLFEVFYVSWGCKVSAQQETSLNTGCEVRCVPLPHRTANRSDSSLWRECLSTSALSGPSIKAFHSLQRISFVFLSGEYYFNAFINEMIFFTISFLITSLLVGWGWGLQPALRLQPYWMFTLVLIDCPSFHLWITMIFFFLKICFPIPFAFLFIISPCDLWPLRWLGLMMCVGFLPLM